MPHGEESKDNLVYDGLQAAYKKAGQPMPPLICHCINRVPFARGLGSSSAAIVGGIIAGLALTGHRLSVWGDTPRGGAAGGVDPHGEELLQLACEIEGHPDNVAPALYGGIQLGIHTAGPNLPHTPEHGRWLSARVKCPAYLQVGSNPAAPRREHAAPLCCTLTKASS